MLSPEERVELLDLLPSLAPGADAAPVVRFFLDRREDCLGELAAVPGHDQVRTGLLRLLPAVLPDEPETRERALETVERAIEAYAPGDLTHVEALRRHPAWVALCALELAAQRGTDPQVAEERALSLATSGFSRVSAGEARGAGEVLWAVAEAAGDVGWTDHVEPLLDQAARSAFADPENYGRVRLLQILRLVADDETRASAAVDALLQVDPLDPQTRVHTLWIGAHLDRQHERLERAVLRLEEAAGLVDAEEEPEILARIHAALQTLGVRSGDAAEA